MKLTPKSPSGLALLAALCVGVGAGMAAGADASATAPAQGEVIPAAEAANAAGATEQGQPEAEHKIPKHAEKPTAKFPITNSMIATWIVAALIIWSARGATRQLKKVPDGR